MPNYKLINGIHRHEGVRYEAGVEDHDTIFDISEESAERIGLHRLVEVDDQGNEMVRESSNEEETEDETPTPRRRSRR